MLTNYMFNQLQMINNDIHSEAGCFQAVVVPMDRISQINLINPMIANICTCNISFNIYRIVAILESRHMQDGTSSYKGDA